MNYTLIKWLRDNYERFLNGEELSLYSKRLLLPIELREKLAEPIEWLWVGSPWTYAGIAVRVDDEWYAYHIVDENENDAVIQARVLNEMIKLGIPNSNVSNHLASFTLAGDRVNPKTELTPATSEQTPKIVENENMKGYAHTPSSSLASDLINLISTVKGNVKGPLSHNLNPKVMAHLLYSLDSNFCECFMKQSSEVKESDLTKIFLNINNTFTKEYMDGTLQLDMLESFVEERRNVLNEFFDALQFFCQTIKLAVPLNRSRINDQRISASSEPRPIPRVMNTEHRGERRRGEMFDRMDERGSCDRRGDRFSRRY